MHHRVSQLSLSISIALSRFPKGIAPVLSRENFYRDFMNWLCNYTYEFLPIELQSEVDNPIYSDDTIYIDIMDAHLSPIVKYLCGLTSLDDVEMSIYRLVREPIDLESIKEEYDKTIGVPIDIEVIDHERWSTIEEFVFIIARIVILEFKRKGIFAW